MQSPQLSGLSTAEPEASVRALTSNIAAPYTAFGNELGVRQLRLLDVTQLLVLLVNVRPKGREGLWPARFCIAVNLLLLGPPKRRLAALEAVRGIAKRVRDKVPFNRRPAARRERCDEYDAWLATAFWGESTRRRDQII